MCGIESRSPTNPIVNASEIVNAAMNSATPHVCGLRRRADASELVRLGRDPPLLADPAVEHCPGCHEGCRARLVGGADRVAPWKRSASPPTNPERRDVLRRQPVPPP
jgi:hypothetical protein